MYDVELLCLFVSKKPEHLSLSFNHYAEEYVIYLTLIPKSWLDILTI